MSLNDLKSLAASNPELNARLGSVRSIEELQAIAREVGITIEQSELEDKELSPDELSAVTGGIGMMIRSKLGFGLMSAAASTNDLDDCTTDTKDDTPTCKPVVTDTKDDTTTCKPVVK